MSCYEQFLSYRANTVVLFGEEGLVTAATEEYYVFLPMVLKAH